MLLGNKTPWDNYQGVSETEVDKMEKNHPEADEEFWQIEQALEQWLGSLE
ncbi:MAG: hypothetical protein OSA48_04785 [Akkermansiaceae bacterium]|nr:hypothetical protein [Akkermansiaceae bacterium]|tara:strand:- start:1641 stop:1790 length:150 start_codon:yes stop_codon:yes gene_type:complete